MRPNWRNLPNELNQWGTIFNGTATIRTTPQRHFDLLIHFFRRRSANASMSRLPPRSFLFVRIDFLTLTASKRRCLTSRYALQLLYSLFKPPISFRQLGDSMMRLSQLLPKLTISPHRLCNGQRRLSLVIRHAKIVRTLATNRQCLRAKHVRKHYQYPRKG